MDTQVETKAEFASRIGVSPGRISQLISEGKLGPAEMEGEGRRARIRVGPACEALKIRLNASQMTGNGASTRLAAPRPAEPQEAPAQEQQKPRTEADELELSFKRAKLAEQESRNRKLAEEERVRAGIYIDAEAAKSEMARLAGKLLQSFEGGLTEIATDIASKYQLPQRDVLHMLKTRFRDVRGKIAGELRETAATEVPLEPADQPDPLQ